MAVDLFQELFNQLSSCLEDIESQHAALLEFLKDGGTINEDQFAPYLERAGKASSVRWRATRIRMESLFRALEKKETELREDQASQKSESKVTTPRSAENQAQANNENETNRTTSPLPSEEPEKGVEKEKTAKPTVPGRGETNDSTADPAEGSQERFPPPSKTDDRVSTA